MNKELLNKLKKELTYLGILFIIALALFQILFYKESFFIVFKTILAFFWLLVLPGFYLLYYWHEKLKFIERFAIGVALSAAIIGISSYYFGIIGLHIKFHGIILPLIFLIISFFIIWKKSKSN